MIMWVRRSFPNVVVLLALAISDSIGAAPLVQSKQVDIFGQRIHYLEAGSGPAVVLLHGLGGDVTNWQPTVPALASNFHVYVLDQIGFGESDKPLIKYRVATLVDFLDEFLRKNAIEKVSLVGNSLGGWTAAAFAQAYPQKIDKLVLVDAWCPWYGPKPTDDWFARNDPVTVEGYRQLLKDLVYNKQLITDQVVADNFAKKLKYAHAISAFIESVRRAEDYLDLKTKTINVPTLVIWGHEDRATFLEMGEALVRDIRGAQKMVIDKCGHFPQLECSSAFNTAVETFLLGQR
jgi:2-hydroxy-6-oxonona-2,4-dienedioate hydrolase